MRYIFWRVIIIAIITLLAAGVFWGARKVIDLARNRNSILGEETLVQRGFTPLGQWGKRDTDMRITSREVIVVGGEEVRVINDTAFFQKGDIVVRDRGKLIFTNSVIEMTSADEPRANIFVRDKGEIVFESSTLKPHADDVSNLYVNLFDEARFVFNNSQGIHMLVASGSARIEMNNSTWAYTMANFRGGGLGVRDAAQAHIKNSKIGGLALEFSPDAKADIRDFKAGVFEKFSVRENFKTQNADFNVILENTEILDDYYEGASSRGLSIFAPAGIKKLHISDSVLNRLVIASSDESLAFSGLDLGYARDFSYRNINLKNSAVMAQWGFSMHGGRGTFSDSKGLWLSMHGDAEISLISSVMNEFVPLDFTGVLNFDGVIWKNAGAIMGNNDFLWRGSWMAQGFDNEDFSPLIWDKSKVTREFPIDVFVSDPGPEPVSAAKIEVFDARNNLLSEVLTNKEGRAHFLIYFDDSNYKENFSIKVAKGGKEVKHRVNFLTPTPIKLILN